MKGLWGSNLRLKKLTISVYLPGICGKTGAADSSNMSSKDPWMELWYRQDGWGTRGNPIATESE